MEQADTQKTTLDDLDDELDREDRPGAGPWLVWPSDDYNERGGDDFRRMLQSVRLHGG